MDLLFFDYVFDKSFYLRLSKGYQRSSTLNDWYTSLKRNPNGTLPGLGDIIMKWSH